MQNNRSKGEFIDLGRGRRNEAGWKEHLGVTNADLAACYSWGEKKKHTMLLLQGLEERKNAHLCTSLGIYFSLRFVEMQASKIHKAPVSAQPRYSSAGCLSCPPFLLSSSFGSSCPLLCTTQRNFCHPCPLPPAGSRYQVSHAKARQVCGRYFCLRDAIRQLLQSTETPPNGCSVLIF